jgi:hypothetical protein
VCRGEGEGVSFPHVCLATGAAEARVESEMGQEEWESRHDGEREEEADE